MHGSMRKKNKRTNINPCLIIPKVERCNRWIKSSTCSSAKSFTNKLLSSRRQMSTRASERSADPFIPLSIHPSHPPSTHPSIHRQAQVGGEEGFHFSYRATAFIMALPQTKTHRILTQGDIIRPHPSIGLSSPSSASGREGLHK